MGCAAEGGGTFILPLLGGMMSERSHDQYTIIWTVMKDPLGARMRAEWVARILGVGYLDSP